MKSLRLRLPRMMELRGASLPKELGESAVRDFARAVRRCERCPSPDACDAYLQAGDFRAAPAFCPNTRYIDSLKIRP